MKSNTKIVLDTTDKQVLDKFYKFFMATASADDSLSKPCLEMCSSVNNWLMKYAVDEDNRPYAYCG